MTTTDLTPIPEPDGDPITPAEADAIAEDRGIEPTPHPVSIAAAGPPVAPVYNHGPFAIGDAVRLRSGPEVTGMTTAWNAGTGEWRVEWAPPYDRLDQRRLPVELEHVPPPSLLTGERVWIPGTVVDGAPDADGEIEIRTDDLRMGGSGPDFVYVHPDEIHRLLRPHAVKP